MDTQEVFALLDDAGDTQEARSRLYSRHAGTLLLKENLIHAVWGADANTNSTSVHQYLHVLRKLYRDNGIDLSAVVSAESKVGWRIATQHG